MRGAVTRGQIPPDGGYGWVIVFANALNSFLTVPLIQCFGLIFKDTFAELNFSATQGSLIINLNGAFGFITGLLNGALLKVFGCRKVATVAALLLTSGVVLTSFARSFTHFIISYGLITSLGVGLLASACNLALNTYFKEKRSVARGVAMTITGLGPVIIPQLIGLLMTIYSVQGTTLILGGICSHAFVAAVLLQPVEWHMKHEETEEQKEDLLEDCSKSVWTRIFDLDLLKDPIFDNILMGMALAILAEHNFTVLTPFMLYEIGLGTGEIATFLSTHGVADLVFRFLAPYIGGCLKQSPRLMYAYSLILLMVTRFLFLLTRDFYVLLAIALALGIGKGIRKVYMGLVVPAHVPMEKLPSASGMAMTMNGICILIGGPLLGLIRDLSGTYFLSVVAMNCVTFSTIFIWGLEVFIVNYRRQKSAETGMELKSI